MSQVVYEGNLRNRNTHLQSGTVINTDAPEDNHGKGESFSPTDLVATATASCMLTIMGIIAERKSIDIESCKAEVEKIMAENPRRISEIQVRITFPDIDISETELKLLKRAALNCPVAKSISPDVALNVEFNK